MLNINKSQTIIYTMPYPSDNVKKETNKLTDKRNTTVKGRKHHNTVLL